jgi:hypothetical protein
LFFYTVQFWPQSRFFGWLLSSSIGLKSWFLWWNDSSTRYSFWPQSWFFGWLLSSSIWLKSCFLWWNDSFTRFSFWPQSWFFGWHLLVEIMKWFGSVLASIMVF